MTHSDGTNDKLLSSPAGAQIAVGSRVDLVFRCLFTAGGVHNYFWKARVFPDQPATTQ